MDSQLELPFSVDKLIAICMLLGSLSFNSAANHAPHTESNRHRRTERVWLARLVSSRHERKALRYGSNSALTAEMFRGWFSRLSILKLILFQSKSNSSTRHYQYMYPRWYEIQKCNTGNWKRNCSVYVIHPCSTVR